MYLFPDRGLSCSHSTGCIDSTRYIRSDLAPQDAYNLIVLKNNHLFSMEILGSVNLFELWQQANFHGSFKWSSGQ